MARPRLFPTDETLSRIRDVFWEHGFEATSLADIMVATGLNKGSLYADFGDKRTMYFKALAAYDAEHVDGAIAIMAALPGRDAVTALMQLPAEAVRAGDTRGCFLCNSSQEARRLDPESQTLASTSRSRLQGAIMQALYHTYPDREFAKVDADYWIALYFGLRILARSGSTADHLSRIAKHATDQL